MGPSPPPQQRTLTASLAPANQNPEPAMPLLATSVPLSCCSLGLASPSPNFQSLLRPAHPWTLSSGVTSAHRP